MTSSADDRFMLQTRKRMPTPREEVFRRWSSPEGMRRSLVQHDPGNARSELDKTPRPGGDLVS